MRHGLLALCCALVFWGAVTQPAGGQAIAPRDTTQGPPSLDLGVYTAVQATRGKAYYDAFCAACHTSDLSGSLAADTGAPPLRGAPFLASLEKTGIAPFFDYVKATMPADDPSTLRDAEYVDILAYLFQANGFPAGTRELTLPDLPHLRVRPTGR